MTILVVPTLNSLLVFRLRDSAVQHMNERILECEANVGEEEVKLQLLTPPGKDLDTVLDQLSALQVCFTIKKSSHYRMEEINTKYYFLKYKVISHCQSLLTGKRRSLPYQPS